MDYRWQPKDVLGFLVLAAVIALVIAVLYLPSCLLGLWWDSGCEYTGDIDAYEACEQEHRQRPGPDVW